jgi:HlyD family secretion protein
MKKRMRVVAPIALVVVAAITLWLTVFRDRETRGEIVASGTVEATEGRLGFQSAGRIEAVMVREGDRVKRGDELAVLDTTEARARRDQAEAQAEAARATLDELERGFRPEEIAQARAARDATAEQREDARRTLERTKSLFDGGTVSRESYEKAQTAFDVASSRHEQAEEQLRLVESGPRPERIEAQRAQLRVAEAGLRASEAALANMTVRTPFDGTVSARHREPGEVVAAGSPVVTVMNPGDRWVRIFIREDRAGAVSVGMPAEITADSHPGRTYKGEVAFVASEAEFTPKSVQTAEERVKLVYAVKVRVLGDAEMDLKPGMPADVRLRPAGTNERGDG